MKIPQLLFTYWEGDELSILHYYTILSLHLLNPELDITIYTSNNPCNSFRQWNGKFHSLPITKTINYNTLININPDKIHLKEVDFINEYNINPNISCVFKADFIRIAKLYEHGGMWFDMDILFTKQIPSYLFTVDSDILYFYYKGVVPTGLLFAKAKSIFMTDIFNDALSITQRIIPNQNCEYETIGPTLWTKHMNSKGMANYYLIDTTDIYPYLWDQLDLLYSSNTDLIKTNTWGIHWYNGDPFVKQFINNFDINTFNSSNNIMNREIYKIKELAGIRANPQ